MKPIYTGLLVAFALLLPTLGMTQPPGVLAMMVNACGTEADNEYIILQTGGVGFNTSDLIFDFDTGNNTPFCATCNNNNDIHTNNGNNPGNTTPCGLQPGDVSMLQNCTTIAVGEGFQLPPNAYVLLQLSSNPTEPIDLSPICGAASCIFVVRSDCMRGIGALTHNSGSGSGTRTYTFAINNTPFSFSYTYDLASMPISNGTYYLNSSGTFGVSANCAAPPVGTAPGGPDFDDPMDISACAGDLGNFPAITGTGLTGNESYYSMSMGMGTAYAPGDPIPGAGTYFIFDATAACSDEEDLVVTVLPSPTANIPTDDLIVCYSFSPPSFTENSIAILDQITGGDPTLTVRFYFDMAGTNEIDLTDPNDQFTIINTQPTTIFATVDNGTCESATVPISIQVSQFPEANTASITACGTPTATFDLTTLDATVNGGNGNTVTYFTDMAATMPIGTPGAYTSGSVTIYATTDNGICESQPVAIDLTVTAPPAIDPIADVTACGAYTLPAYTGTNLGAGPFSYYTQPNGGGTAFAVGTDVTSSGTFYAYTGTAGCDDEESFVLTIQPQPQLDPVASVTACGVYTLPAITGTDLPVGPNFYYDAPNGGGAAFAPGTDLTQSGTYYIYVGDATCNDEVSFDLTVTPNPVIDPLTDATACGSYTLPAITGTDLGTPAYFTGPNATGTSFAPGATVTASGTYYAYAGAPGCGDEVSFVVTITPQPQLDPVTDVTACDTYTLPAITGTDLPAGPNFYYDAPNGGGTSYAVGTDLTQSGTYYIFVGDATCNDEVSLDLTLTPAPAIDPLADVSACGDFVLPAITGSDLSGTPTYFSGPGGTGTSFAPGSTVTNGGTYYAFAGSPGCSDEESFVLTLDPQPQLDPVADVTTCGAYTLPAITGTDLPPGPNFYYDAPNGGGTAYTPGTDLLQSGTYFVYVGTATCNDETSFQLVLTSQPDIDPIADVTVCGEYILPAITGTDIAGAFYTTGPGGTGQAFFPGDAVMTSGTYFAYVGSPGCEDEETFDVTLTQQPQLDPVSDVTVCGPYTLPAITGTDLPAGPQFYYDAPNGSGMAFAPGSTVDQSGIYFIYVGDATCNDEVNFAVTITDQPQLDPIADVTTCDMYTLPAITGSDVAGAFFATGPGGSGTTFAPGDMVTTGGTYFAYTGSAGCEDEESFSVTVLTSPDLVPNGPSPNICQGENIDLITLLTDQANTAASLTFHSATPPTAGNQLASSLVSPNVTTTYYAFAEGQTLNNVSCTDELAITINVATTPDLTGPGGPLTGCAEVTLPMIEGTDLSNPAYYTQSDGMGTQLMPGDAVSTAGTLFLFDGAAGCSDEMMLEVVLTGAPTLSATTDPQTCPGENTAEFTLTIADGMAPYTVVWDDPAIQDGQLTVSDVGVGAYTATVTDANACTSMLTVTVTAFAESISLQCTQQDPATGPGMADGSVTVEVSGGNFPATLSYTGPQIGSEAVNQTGMVDLAGLLPGTYTVTVENANGCTETCSVTINTAGCDLVIADVLTTPVSCAGANDGAIDVQLSGGTAPFAFVWSPDQSDTDNPTALAGGLYTFTVTDANNCVVQGSATVQEPDSLTLVATPLTDAGPDNNVGSADVTFGGGTPPYNVAVTGPQNSNTTSDMADVLPLTGLAAGLYTVTLTDANGCSLVVMLLIAEEGCDLQLVLSPKDILCNGDSTGEIGTDVLGGTPPYIFVWSPDQGGVEDPMNLPAGDYSVTVTDSEGCEAIAQATVTEPPLLTLSCTPIEGGGPADDMGVVLLDIAGGILPYKLEYVNTTGPGVGSKDIEEEGMNDLSGLSAGIYEVVLSDANGCETTCTFIIEAFGCDFVLSDIITTPASCADSNDGSITLLPGPTGTPPYQYFWVPTDINTQDSQAFDLAAGDYAVTIVDADNCKEEFNIFISAPDSLLLDCNNPTEATGPMNADGSVTFDFGGGVAPYVLQIMGPTTLDLDADNPGSTLFPALLPGAYTVDLVDANGCVVSCSFFIEDNSCNYTLEILTQDEGCIGVCDAVARAAIDGGVPPFTYLWSDGSTLDSLVACPGMVSVTVTDANDCVMTATATLAPGSPMANITSLPIIGACPDECTTLDFDVDVTDFVLFEFLVGPDEEPLFAESFDGILSVQLCPDDYDVFPGEDLVVQLTQISNGNCVTVMDSVYLVPSLPPNEVLLQPMVCEGDSFMLDGMVFDALDPTGEITLFNADVNGCDSIITVELGFFPPATGTLPQTVCEGGSFDFGGMTFDAATPTGDVVLPGASSNGCDSTVTVTLNFSPAVTGTLAQTLCEGETFDFGGMTFDAMTPTGDITLPNGSVNGCDSIVTVQLDFFAPATGTLNQTVCENEDFIFGGMTFNQATPAGDVILPGASVEGCDSTVTVQLDFFAPATGTLNQTVCENEDFTFGGMTFNQATPAGDVILPGASVEGCDSTVTVQLDFFAPATGTLTTTLCADETLMIGGVTFDAVTPMGEVTLPGASMTGCDSTVVVQLDFFEPALGSLAPVVCEGESFELGGVTFDATMPTGTVVLPTAATNGCDSLVDVSLSFAPPAVGNLAASLCGGESLEVGGTIFDSDNPSGTVVLPGASVLGCDSTVTVTIDFIATAFAVLEAPAAVCTGEDITVLLTVNPDLVLHVVLSVNGVMEEFTDLTGVTELTFVGLTDLTITISSAEVVTPGVVCPVVLGDPVTIAVSDLQVQIEQVNDYGGFGVSCAGNADGAVTVVTTGGVEPFTYAWNNGDPTASLSNLPTGTYTVLVTDAAGCTATAEITLNAPDPITVSVTGLAGSCLNPAAAAIQVDTLYGGTPPYEYSFDDVLYSPLGTAPFRIEGLTAGTYTLYVQDLNDCRTELTVVVPDFDEYTLDLGDDLDIVIGDSVRLGEPITNIVADSIFWSSAVGLSDVNALRPYFNPTVTTTYELTLFDADGCSVSDIITVFVDTRIPAYVPTIFSPNGDGVNDRFTIQGGSRVQTVDVFRIFDRWGNLVFESDPFGIGTPSTGWDGTFNGKPLNPAVFVYYAALTLADGRQVEIRGDVTLVR